MFSFKVEKVKRTHPCNFCGKLLKTGTHRIYFWPYKGRYCLKCGFRIAERTLIEAEKDIEDLKKFIKGYPFGVAVAEEL